jgi:glycosyltransferase involved in cell wall biosynthesis
VLKRVSAVRQEKEIIVVDDCSTDGTRDILRSTDSSSVKVLFHEKNMGKGAAIRTGLSAATGEAIIVQDADLEYNPEQYGTLLKPLERGEADAVYGSRFRGGGVFLLRSRLANRVLTAMTNLLFGAHLSDMETCYKMMRTEVARAIDIRSNGFDVEPEVTAKLLKRRYRIREVPISYQGRGSLEGKKIGWKDGLKAIMALVRYRFRE